MVVQDFPEGFPLAQLLRAPAAQWKDPTAQPNGVLGRLHAGGGEIDFKSPGITMNEIENAVSPSVHPGNQVGPSHRTLRRYAGGKKAKGSLLRQGGEIRHHPFLHEARQELGIHAVDSKDDQLFIPVPLAAHPAA